jgi:hypothetical protein
LVQLVKTSSDMGSLLETVAIRCEDPLRGVVLGLLLNSHGTGRISHYHFRQNNDMFFWAE